jgi:tRNA A-37 threonylcarbamoyl transferase component Bud32
LKAIHAAGILHGDIDARNLLINDASETTIIDFAFSVISPHPRELGMEQEQLSNVLSQVADGRPMQSIT